MRAAGIGPRLCSADDHLRHLDQVGKKSRISPTLLSNFFLGLILMKNVAKRFSDPDAFYEDYGQQMSYFRNVEKTLFQLESLDGSINVEDDAQHIQSTEGVAVSFLIN